jgi:hypothetical protein
MPMLVPMNAWNNSWKLKWHVEENEELIDKIELLEWKETLKVFCAFLGFEIWGWNTISLGFE